MLVKLDIRILFAELNFADVSKMKNKLTYKIKWIRMDSNELDKRRMKHEREEF